MVDEAMFITETEALLKTLHRISVSILKTEADAQDAVQQGLERAWARKDTVQPEKFRAWITRIVVNECRNIQRHRMRVSPAPEVFASETYAPPDLDVTEAIGRLPEKWRTPFLLKYASEYKEREIAQALGIPVTTVKSRLFSARRALRQQLSDKEVTFG